MYCTEDQGYDYRLSWFMLRWILVHSCLKWSDQVLPTNTCKCTVDNRKSILQIQEGLQKIKNIIDIYILTKAQFKNDSDYYNSKGHRSNSKQKINNSKITFTFSSTLLSYVNITCYASDLIMINAKMITKINYKFQNVKKKE